MKTSILDRIDNHASYEIQIRMDPHGNAFYSDLFNNEYSFDLSGEYSTQPSRSSQIRVEEESTQKKNTRYKQFKSERTANSLMHRWSSIQLAVGKFHGYFMQIEARQQSGINEQDKVCQAMEMYLSFHHSTFQFLHCWNELKNLPKWCTESSKKKSKNTRNASPATSCPSTPDSINLGEDNASPDVDDAIVGLERPLGRKAAKERLKRGKGKQIAENMDGMPITKLFEEYKEEQKMAKQERKEQFDKLYAQE
ncbi:hypothetical protein QJS04_geneDACA014451 [Acorus gramineus]|uniref:No apical meristem-associated C-terminal domain-containing protein n=1 Tax=Acorus gramineus TaxID=55184 RepID=A0AAV9BJL9_ACOGR|nr:hypothetical protein QJS04_geneDACA014451 [Acorus gramineus]